MVYDCGSINVCKFQAPLSTWKPENSCRKCGRFWRPTLTPVASHFSGPCSRRTRTSCRGSRLRKMSGPRSLIATILASTRNNLPPPGSFCSGEYKTTSTERIHAIGKIMFNKLIDILKSWLFCTVWSLIILLVCKLQFRAMFIPHSHLSKNNILILF